MTKLTITDFYAFKIKNMWKYFKGEHFSFWMVCCYLFVELVRPQSLFPAIDILPWAMAFILLSAIGAVIDPSVKWVSSIANKGIIIFFITILISMVYAYYPSESKKHFIDFFGWFVIYFIIINIVNTKERFYIFLLIYIFAAGKIALGTSKTWVMRGFGFTSWGLMGPQGYFQNSGELAILMLMLFPITFYLYKALKDRVGMVEKGLLLLFWICPILTILGASSRGSQIALVVELLIIFRTSLYKPKALIGVVLLAVSLFYLLPEEQKQRFANTGDDKTSQQRLLYWQHGWDMIKENQATGVGYFNFAPYYEAHFPQDMLYDHAQLPHNIFIQVGTDVGVFGTIIFMLIILYCLIVTFHFSTRPQSDPIKKSIIAGLGYGVLGFVIAGQFVTVTYYPFLWIHLALIVAFCNVVNKTKDASWE